MNEEWRSRRKGMNIKLMKEQTLNKYFCVFANETIPHNKLMG
jgi:hypothetical protein